ncbi:MAG: hypothetical protein BJ554DRAFT_4689 [Olpidium bornovanus]|uniref:Uncharacterized protein n=1 Tax=Olpidium bornovanus TaxID=278681 RepID=A0A8H8A063_9FUNG|nr:MAG: hypothetical protein BJ554DRAFT_4689 [Olpidium bornovanus]
MSESAHPPDAPGRFVALLFWASAGPPLALLPPCQRTPPQAPPLALLPPCQRTPPQACPTHFHFPPAFAD